jgi:hypothetical protein
VEAERVKTPGFNSWLIRHTGVNYRDKITHPNKRASALFEEEESRRLKIFKPTDLTSRFS